LSNARRVPPIAAILVIALSSIVPAVQRGGVFSDLKPTVILISFDGFRWDYPTKAATPNLRRLMARGVHAQNLIPSFPSKTFPNHYTIVTGLYPGHHGIVANNIFDPPTGRTFAPAKIAEVRDPMWWGGVPIWTLVEQAGKASAPLSWPGSEAPHAGVMSHFWQPYDENRPPAARLDQLFAHLDLPAAQRPVFLSVYFEDTDAAGHERGPESQEVRDAIVRDDGYIGVLMDGLARRGIADRVNVVVVSDHGMAPVDDERVMVADDYFSADDAFVSDINPNLSVFPKPGKEDSVYQALVRANQHLKAYRRDEIPERWHLHDHPRVPPVLAVSDEGWQVLRRATADDVKAGKITGLRGQHGYDPRLMSMRAFFVAAGPAFKRGVTVAPFENVHIYNVLARVLGVTPAPNDGDPSLARQLLR
jgi:predicted AlkP superfamily pyrophosphatase or phosphodiesterase